MRCPEGHESTATDYCDVCGAVMGAAEASADAANAGAPAGDSSSPAPGAGQPGGDAKAGGDGARECPNCGAPGVPDALFCEACGYDYTTGTMPRSMNSLDLDTPVDEPAESGNPLDGRDASGPVAPPAAADDGAAVGSPAAGDGQEGGPGQGAADQGGSAEAGAGDTGSGGDAAGATSADGTGAADAGQSRDADAGQSGDADADPGATMKRSDLPGAGGAGAGGDAEATPSPASGAGGTNAPAFGGTQSDANPSAPLRDPWIAEVWIDPAWYRDQGSPDPMPSPGPPDLIVLTKSSLLVGRESTSRGITPDIECGVDNGVSRRHAQLTTDGTRWWVEDLDSANGVWIGDTVGELPRAPIPARSKREFGPDDRIYVGSWTRIVVRKATQDEVDALA